MKNLFFMLVLTLSYQTHAQVLCEKKIIPEPIQVQKVNELCDVTDAAKDMSVYESIDKAVAAAKEKRAPKSTIGTEKSKAFPVYGSCPQPFFRVVTIDRKVDDIITQTGWLSGYERKESGNALPPDAPLSERIIQYVGVKGAGQAFPRNSTIIGVMKEPIRTLSVGWHTGYTNDPSKYMRMDEIEIGDCSTLPACKSVKPIDSTKIFQEDAVKRKAKGLSVRESRYSTEGEFAVENKIPAECIRASYRIKFQKIDGVMYRGVN